MKKFAETAYDLSYELSSCERNGVFSSMFRKISVSKQSISSAFYVFEDVKELLYH